jgi:uncharacterized protein YyaL (SSP411 family)
MAFENHLAGQRSPYLRQHLYNPVDWYPWGEEAFAKAAAEDKPVFLSIGYSTCHWCHVMERESFEDQGIARIMNESFVAVKVDREERPDIDKVYMAACQMISGTGGWPLTIVMTPDKKPFFAATYVPRESGHGKKGLAEILQLIRAIWRDQRGEVDASAESITAALAGGTETKGAGVAEHETPSRAYRIFTRIYDSVHGGFGEAPKFPSPHNILFLLRYWNSTGEESARDMALKTLEKMRLGGICDHAGFGFHRYSTDERWLLPHFEKMLYDQAMLALAYLEGFQAGGGDLFASVAREIFEYVARDMTAPEGGFYSAEDADSEGREGAFYLWTMDELREVLGPDDAEYAAKIFSLSEEGNFVEQASGRRTGENILHLQAMPGDTDRIESVRMRLLSARERRRRPLRDNKILTDWNGLMIASLAVGSRVLDDRRYLEAAERAAEFVIKKILIGGDRLLHRYLDGDASITGTLDDYAFFVWGLIELYEAGYNTRYLDLAMRLSGSMLQYFGNDNGGLVFSPRDGEPLIAQTVEFYDGAYPSGNSVAFYNLARLGRLTGDPKWEQAAKKILDGALSGIEKYPHGHGMFLAGILFSWGGSCEVVVAGDLNDSVLQKMTQEIRRLYLPQCVVLVKPSGEQEPPLDELAPFVAGMTREDGRSAAYVCRGHRCYQPVHSVADMLNLLSAKST